MEVNGESGIQPLVEMEKVRKVFYTDEIETWAVNDISLKIYQGEYVSITGHSGCGKSTLLSLIGLLSSTTDGSYRLEGENVVNLSQAQKAGIRNRHIGYIFQSFNLISDMNVLDNVILPLHYRSEISKKDRQAMALEALEMVDISYRRNHMPTQLSGGQQQRVAIARAIVGNPSLILADEPTGNLDSKNSQNIIDLLDGLHASGRTICMVTHDPAFAMGANRQIELSDGKIVSK